MISLILLALTACTTHGAPALPEGFFDRKNLRLFPTGRVVGGRTTDISEVPYQLQLEEQGFQFCGASIISARFALTAAHCTDGRTPYGLQVRFASSYHASGGSTVLVEAIFQHPQYNQQTTDYDVSVLRLASPITLGVNARPIQLATSEPYPGQKATVSGWGVQLEGSIVQPFQLQSVSIEIRDRLSCSAAYGYMFTQNMICAGGAGQDSCQGDSGGPLVVGGVQVGVVSWGFGCARVGYPGIYSNVAHLRGFIDMYTGFQARWVSGSESQGIEVTDPE